MVEMKRTEFNPDLLNSAIPGQSLTANPGQFPYEKPPLTSNPEEALEALIEGIQQPSASKTIGMLLDAGVTAETISGSLVIQGISEGAFDPDVAELIKPLLIGYILQEGENQGVTDIDVINSVPQDAMTEQEGFDLMEKMSPDKYNALQQEENIDEDDEMMLDDEEEEMNIGMIDESDNLEESGGFINMRSDV